MRVVSARKSEHFLRSVLGISYCDQASVNGSHLLFFNFTCGLLCSAKIITLSKYELISENISSKNATSQKQLLTFIFSSDKYSYIS